MIVLSNMDSFRIRRIDIEVGPDWVVCNPSITSHRSSLIAAVRVTTLTACAYHGGWFVPPNNKLDNRLFLAFLDNNLRVIGQQELDDRQVRKRSPALECGFEDVRIFSNPFQGNLMGIGNVASPSLDSNAMVLLDLGSGAQLCAATLLQSPHNRQREKNWAPAPDRSRLFFVYEWNPLTILALNSTGPEIIKSTDAPYLRNWRGSSQGLPTDKGWIFIIHRLYLGSPRRYTHRIIEIDFDWNPIRASKEFCFITNELEYCGGVALINETVILSFGLNNHHAFVASLDKRELFSLLEPIASAFSLDEFPLRQRISVGNTDDPRIKLSKGFRKSDSIDGILACGPTAKMEILLPRRAPSAFNLTFQIEMSSFSDELEQSIIVFANGARVSVWSFKSFGEESDDTRYVKIEKTVQIPFSAIANSHQLIIEFAFSQPDNNVIAQGAFIIRSVSVDAISEKIWDDTIPFYERGFIINEKGEICNGAVRHREGENNTGIFLYGPYITLSNGRYCASIHAAIAECQLANGTMRVDAVAQFGSRIFTKQKFEVKKTKEIFKFEFELAEDQTYSNVEIRIAADKDVPLSITDIRIEKLLPPT